MTEPSQYFKGRTVQEQMNEVIGYVDVRSAEVAVDAIAGDMATIHQDKLDAEAAATNAAASAAAAAGTLANAVKKTGEASQSIDGDIDLNDDLNVDGDATVGGALAVTGAITGDDATFTGVVTVPTPSNNTDAVTKKYVDDADALLVPINNINTYAVGLTGNQNNITGDKTFRGKVTRKGGQDNSYFGIEDSFFDIRTRANQEPFLMVYDSNGNRIGGFYIRQNADSTRILRFVILKADNQTYKTIDLADNS